MPARCHIQVADYMEQGGGGANVLKLSTDPLWYLAGVIGHGVEACLLKALLISASDIHRVSIEEHKDQDSFTPDVGVAPPVVYRANENRDVARLASATLRFAHLVDPVEFPCAEPEQHAGAARHVILAPLHDPNDSARIQADDVEGVA